MPVRKVPKNYRNLTGVAASTKAIGPAQFESTLERDYLAILEFSPAVECFETQPLAIEWRDAEGRQRRYTPDVLVRFRPEAGRRPWLCEVKYRSDIQKDWAELHPRLRRGVRHAKRQGWRFRLITEVEVRTPYLTNVRFLAPFKFHGFPDDSVERLLDALTTNQPSTPNALLRALEADLARQGEWLPVLWHLMAHHRIAADLDRALTMDSPIWRAP
jgi:hypothetical protein